MWVMHGHARKLYTNGDLYSASCGVYNKLYSCAIKLQLDAILESYSLKIKLTVPKLIIKLLEKNIPRINLTVRFQENYKLVLPVVELINYTLDT